MIYLALKHLHVTCVALSGLGFFLRGVWMLRDSAALNWRLTRILPHLVDTLLLGSALAMAFISAQYPFAQNWLTAKFFGLLLYILLGSIALKRGKTKAVRATAFLLAVLAYGYVVGAALSRSPWLFLSGAGGSSGL